MEADVYDRLAEHLDKLPGGFPATESGVELRILRRLFTPDDAELALTLTLLAEEPRVIARRAGLPVEEVTRRLEAMERKGLIYGVHTPGKLPQYMAQYFVVGIWEFQVQSLSPELVRDFEEYLPILFDVAAWKKAPQLRTIPVGEAVEAGLEVMAYESAEALVRAHRRISVAPCICRREQHLLGAGCDKPVETCLSFGGGADFYQRNGLGRAIGQEEALALLKEAERAGLVLQPSNSRDATFLCACCGCCCGVLRTLKRYPAPASLVSSPFVVEVEPETCEGCGACTERCQMEALRLVEGLVVLEDGRCIGCGLCVTTCPAGALRLRRKPDSEQPYVPRDVVESSVRLGQARGKMGWPELAGLVVKSKVDRLRTPK